jgi:site-specific DNA recombinase
MKRALLYCRVSTDRQAEEGYSLDIQEESMIRFCMAKSIEVVMIFRDDESGKDFNRPQYKLLREYVKKNHKNIDYVLVAYWDRFARNVMEALIEIAAFAKLKVEVNCTGSWVDKKDISSKLLQFLPLMMAEMENDKTSVKTKEGMRKAASSGRYCNRAPIGYMFIDDEQDLITAGKRRKNRLLTPDIARPNRIEFAKELFKEVNKELECINAIRKKLVLKHGIKCSKNNAYNLLRNKLYKGIVSVPATDDEEGYEIIGRHQPLVTEELFDRVQDIMSGKVKKSKPSQQKRPELFLTNFLVCSDCGKNLYGSPSLNRLKKLYLYYQCNCGFRVRADKVNSNFESHMSKFHFEPLVVDYYVEIVRDVYKGSDEQRKKELKSINEVMIDCQKKLNDALNELVEKRIGRDEYGTYCEGVKAKLIRLKEQKSQLEGVGRDFEIRLKSSALLLKCFYKRYKEVDLATKRKIIGSIYPEKVVVYKNRLRTPNSNSVMSLLCTLGADFKVDKKRRALQKQGSSTSAPRLGLEPRTLRLTV